MHCSLLLNVLIKCADRCVQILRELRTQNCATALCFSALTSLSLGGFLQLKFSAMTMKSVGKAALAMVEEVRRQFNTIAGLMEGTAKPDYKK